MASNFVVFSRVGREAYVQPIIEGDRYTFTVLMGTPPADAARGTAAGKRKAFRCLLSDSPIDYDYIRSEGKAGRIGQKLMAIVAESTLGRVYLSPTTEMETIGVHCDPPWKPEMTLPHNPRDFKTPNYGLTTYGDLFTPRQLVTLNTLSDLVGEVRERIRQDTHGTTNLDDAEGLDSGGTGSTAYAEAVVVYLGICVSKITSYHCTLGIWRAPEGKSGRAFGRQAIPMVWDFPECNPFAAAGGDWEGTVMDCGKVLTNLPTTAPGTAIQCPAQVVPPFANRQPVISTDPPYYDNVGYADLSDFFYVWLRRSLRPFLPSLFSTIGVPKAEELVATPYRHGGQERAEEFFLDGMTQAMRNLADRTRPDAPTAIYYAFKQSDSSSDGTSSTGWETFLEAVFKAGFATSGTWPMRTEQAAALKTKMNSLASSIVLVCRKRAADAPSISRREFIRELNGVLPEALDEMTKGSGDDSSPVAPVDLSQAIIGPGMAVYSKYAAVLEADGSHMSVRTALQLINRFLAEDDFDPDTQFCLHWFEQHGWSEGRFGEADMLSRAKGTSVDGVRIAGVVSAGGGIVRLLRWSEYPSDWDPKTDTRNPVWETLHHLIRALKQDGESGAGALLAAVKGKAEAARQLAYRLYTLCERQRWAEDARAYNELITSWTGIEVAAGAVPGETQADLFA